MDTPTNPFATVRVDPDVVWRGIDDELVLLNVVSGQYFGLNPVGAEVWKLLVAAGESGTSLSELVAQVTGTFDVEPDQARADLVGLLTQLAERRLIVP